MDNLTVQTRDVNDKVLQFISENRPAAQTSKRLTDKRRRYIVNTTRYVDREVPKNHEQNLHQQTQLQQEMRLSKAEQMDHDAERS